MLRESQAMLRKGIRELEREREKMQREEKKLQVEMKGGAEREREKRPGKNPKKMPCDG